MRRIWGWFAPSVGDGPQALPGGLSIRTWSLITAAGQTLVTAAFLARYRREMAGPGTNLDLYLSFANRTLNGEIPYRQFEVEYPIFALPLMVLPRLFASGLTGYLVAFAAEMALINALTIYLVARRIEREGGRVFAGLAWFTIFNGLLCPLIFTRYDLAPTMLGFATAALWSSGRNSWGGIASGAGALMKVFPGVCALPSIVREVLNPRTTRLRGTLSLSAMIVLGTVMWMLVGGSGFWTSLKYHTTRGIEIGSIYAAFGFVLGWAFGDWPGLIFNFGAFHLTGSWADRMIPFVFPAQIVSIVAVLVMYWYSRFADELRYAAAALLAFAIMGKVLSPQYMIWLVPFMVALKGPVGRVARPLFAVSCFATTLIYPVFFNSLVALKPGPVALLLVRNALLLALLALLTFGSHPRTSAVGADAPSPGE